MEQRGLCMFELSRMAIHNGPGLRTMLHFKGCPLRCAWCSTPESQSPAPQLSFTRSLCVGCGRCAPLCPEGCLRPDGAGRCAPDFVRCTGCLRCVPACPSRALSAVGVFRSADSLFSELSRDKPFFDKTGGGVTFSGGEPLREVSPELFRLLQKLRTAGISMGFDTCGFVPRENLARVLPYADFFLWDLKQMDARRHKEATGVSNEPILENLRFADEAGAALYLRCPIIPGVNDGSEHLASVLALVKTLRHAREIHLLPLHHLGTSRYERLGLRDPFAHTEAVPDGVLLHMAEALEDSGLPVRIIR